MLHDFSIILTASYAFDWALLVALAVLGYVVNNLTPNHHAFSLVDPSISYPLHADTVSIGIAAVVAGIAPVVIILVITLIFVPGPTVPKGTPLSLVWKRRLWELHASWLGLATSLAAAWFLTNGLKQLVGKPRPNMLARCQPNLSNIADYVVGGVLTAVSDGRLVTSAICTNQDKAVVDEGFRSFPSGHTTISAAGLVYLTLLLASKLSVGIPFLHPRSFTEDETHVSAFPSRTNYQNISSLIPLETRGASQQHTNGAGYDGISQRDNMIAARNQAATPPLYLIIIMLLPLGTAVFISTSRWYDFQHHGFDILVSFAAGTLFAILSFRYYHLPIGRGAGWAWGPRSKSRAFFAGIGSAGYAGDKLATNESLV
ncbi:PAP2 superfamily-domain-containing protein [Ustulina deusta]|nr:PAP2 superfamily-domain-containing protein [Ustulina deusta]KAI3330644.1 PAP2 superfamily-domain-containing protein [Ustulina deusta]